LIEAIPQSFASPTLGCQCVEQFPNHRLKRGRIRGQWLIISRYRHTLPTRKPAEELRDEL
jgi:hypothetical protein